MKGSPLSDLERHACILFRKANRQPQELEFKFLYRLLKVCIHCETYAVGGVGGIAEECANVFWCIILDIFPIQYGTRYELCHLQIPTLDNVSTNFEAKIIFSSPSSLMAMSYSGLPNKCNSRSCVFFHFKLSILRVERSTYSIFAFLTVI